MIQFSTPRAWLAILAVFAALLPACVSTPTCADLTAKAQRSGMALQLCEKTVACQITAQDIEAALADQQAVEQCKP